MWRRAVGTPIDAAIWAWESVMGSEEGHLDDRPLLDEILAGGYLYIAVRLRHAGDVARRLERRDRFAVHDPHRVELVAARRRGDACAQRQRGRPRRRGGEPR